MGARAHNHKVSEDDVCKIVHLLTTTTLSLTAIGVRMGISKGTVQKISAMYNAREKRKRSERWL